MTPGDEERQGWNTAELPTKSVKNRKSRFFLPPHKQKLLAIVGFGLLLGDENLGILRFGKKIPKIPDCFGRNRDCI